jgi:hypothetical protein
VPCEGIKKLPRINVGAEKAIRAVNQKCCFPGYVFSDTGKQHFPALIPGKINERLCMPSLQIFISVFSPGQLWVRIMGRTS